MRRQVDVCRVVAPELEAALDELRQLLRAKGDRLSPDLLAKIERAEARSPIAVQINDQPVRDGNGAEIFVARLLPSPVLTGLLADLRATP